MRHHLVECGSDDVILLNKLFGPMGFADLRIKADVSRGGWVIERQRMRDGAWFEWAFIPGQLEDDYDEEDR